MIHLWNGDKTFREWALLGNCIVSKLNVSSINTIPAKYPCTSSDVAENRYSMLISLNKSVYTIYNTIKVVHNSSKAAKLNTDEFVSLQSVPQLSLGVREVLPINLEPDGKKCFELDKLIEEKFSFLLFHIKCLWSDIYLYHRFNLYISRDSTSKKLLSC